MGIRRFVNDFLFPSWFFLLMAINNLEDLSQRQYRNLYYLTIFLIKIFRIFCSSRPRHIISILEYSNRLGLGIFWSSGPLKDISVSASTYLGLGIFESTQEIPCLSLGNFKSTRPRNAFSVSASRNLDLGIFFLL
jgi:hypothetical protein